MRRAAALRPAASSVSPSSTTYSGSGSRVGSCEPGEGGNVAGGTRERRAVLPTRSCAPVAGELEVAQQRSDVGDVLVCLAAGRQRPFQCIARSGQIAVQLTKVGDARVGVEVGPEIDHALQRPAGGVVAPQLDVGVDDHGEGLDDLGCQLARAQAVAQRSAEVVTGEAQHAARGVRPGVGRIARQGADDRPAGP